MEAGLKLRFTKGSGKVDRLDLIQPDGTTHYVDCPKQRIIPHDMVHFAVEEVLAAQGFLSRVRDGEVADVRMAGNAISDGVERLVEVMQADGWSPGGGAADVIALYHVTCDARSCPPLPITEKLVARLRERIAALTMAWDAVAVGEAMELRLG